MYAVERLSSFVTQGVYMAWGPFHPFGGAVDIIVVQQQDGSLKSSPWYVKFGKFQGMLKTKEKVVNIIVNGVEAGFHMYLNHRGEAYFVKEVEGNEESSDISSPSSSDKTDEQSHKGMLMKAEALNSDKTLADTGSHVNRSNGKIMTKANSRRSRIFGLMFGGKSMKDSKRLGKGGISLERISSLERAEFAADLLEMKWSTNLPTNKWKVKNDSEAPSLENKKQDTCKDFKVGKKKAPEVVSTDLDRVLCLRSHEQVSPPPASRAMDFADSRENFSELPAQKIDELGEENVAYDLMVKHSAFQALDLSSGGYKEVQYSNEVLRGTSAPISKDVSDPECVQMGKENLNECTHWYLGLARSEDSRCHYSHASYQSEAVSENSLVTSTDEASSMGDVGQTITESCSSVDTCLLSLNSIETEKTELAQDAKNENFTPEKTLEMAATFENQCRIISPTNLVSGNEAIDEKAFTKPAFAVQMDEDDITCDSKTCDLGHLLDRVQEVENCREGIKTCGLHISLEITIDPQQDSMTSSQAELVNSIMRSSNRSEEQLSTSNIENFQFVSSDVVRTGNHPAEAIEEVQELNDVYHDMSVSSGQSLGSCSSSTTSLFSEELVEETSPDTIEVSPEKLRTQSSPMCIPGGRIHIRGVRQCAGSLPNIRSHIHDIEWSDIQKPLSRSLDVSSGNPNWGILEDDFSSTSKTKAMFESHIAHENPTTDVTATVASILGTREHEGISTSPAVELSLCKHLIFEGMGAEAASQAFDAEKIDLDKLRDLGPSVVKNDHLIVRIGGCYFPWDAAAPIISGMVSFDQECILKPEGMIAVDQVEKTPISELSRTISPSGGGWRLWPLHFRKTKSVKSSRQSLDTTKGTDTENVSEDSLDRTVNKTKEKKKKMIRSIIPTSEQLASLNLKEGQNVITFTFSTAMLGRQQVDARIYLWKWNTRIIVSDVDGTITKSDVLGQFMPLVGRDWSQTGVAHLFSAIKENGYELLFLSARAISQAYHTRQFLFNLKQDGKALPDGPVVISPDGLFPSLFREVIKRAPHEFKIACLEDIRALFPPECNPFYAGFGNRDTDEISYLKIGISKSKIFIINPKGEVVVNRRFHTNTYTSLHSLVNSMFPLTVSAEQEEFNSWNYWKMPLPEIAI